MTGVSSSAGAKSLHHRHLSKLGRTAALLGLVLAAALQAPVHAQQAVRPKLSVGELQARHRLPHSRFAVIDGVPVHYTDEGRGPVVLLLHGSYLDLTSWDDWARELARDHRVIRLDRVRFGLTGTFPDRPPDYESEQKLIDALVARLKLKRFALAGSSSGGIVAAQYADRHPAKVERLILMNFPLGHGRISAAPSHLATAGPSPTRMRDLLEYNLVDHSVITPQLLRRLTDFSDREDPLGTIAAAFRKAGALTEDERAKTLGRIRAPTLVIWSAENRTLPPAAGRAAFDAIGSREKFFTLVQGAGHMLPLEKGPETAILARRFLTGAKPPEELGAPSRSDGATNVQ